MNKQTSNILIKFDLGKKSTLFILGLLTAVLEFMFYSQLSLNLFNHLSISPSIRPSICRFVHLSVCPKSIKVVNLFFQPLLSSEPGFI